MGIVITHPSELGPVQLNAFGDYDIREMYHADSGKIYYMSLPKRYFTYKIVQITLVNFLLSLCFFSYWIASLVPMYVILFFKINMFISWCRTLNLSSKKLWTFFIAETVLLQILCIFLRSLLKTILY